ncbi:MAG: DUF4417 domain-containing protein [Alphaproteobacteria bacterium]|nr:DUF4417 domain-containing protein [Alphaproteobacteria bacterium]
MDCLDLCCKAPDRCTRVCRNRPEDFVDQIREIDGFEFHNVPRAPAKRVHFRSNVVPLIYHGSSRARALRHDMFALRLPDLVSFKTARLKFADRAALCRSFGIDPAAQIILTGANLDHRIEPWWSLGAKRVPLIQAMVSLGIELVTAPNFSVVLDQPRTDDMHAMKRIAIVFSEFQEHGLACALHPNGRTDKDFDRWARFIADRGEVSVLAYEFITGPGRVARKPFHLARLADLSRAAGLDLDIIVRGDPSVIPYLRQHFRNVVYIETTAFMKSIKRQRAERVGNDRLRWTHSPTAPDGDIDQLFAHNLKERSALLALHYYGQPFVLPEAA